MNSDFPGIAEKLVRICEITGNFHRCKNFLENFCQGGGNGGNGAEFLTTEVTEEAAEVSSEYSVSSVVKGFKNLTTEDTELHRGTFGVAKIC